MKEIKAWHCDFCKKYSKSEQFMKQHEKTCCFNPITKSCATCIHFKQKQYKTKTDFGQECIGEIPVCDEDVAIAELTDKGKKLSLKTKCPLWEDEPYEQQSTKS